MHERPEKQTTKAKSSSLEKLMNQELAEDVIKEKNDKRVSVKHKSLFKTATRNLKSAPIIFIGFAVSLILRF